MLKPNQVSSMPSSPGCYLFKDDKGSVLYVGKAKNLKKRVSNYFQKKGHDPKTALLVTHIKDIDFIVTKTESEALLLENNLIKLHYPKFNLDLKDSRRYAYIRLNDEEIPWLEVARIRGEKGEYFGPFVSGMIRKVIMDLVSWNFKVLTKKPSPQLKKIMLPNIEDYKKRVAQVRKILKGNDAELVSELNNEMIAASKKENFEYALTLRNQIAALQTLNEKQVMEFTRTIDGHVINYTIVGDEVYLLVFNIRKGVVEEKQEFSFQYYEEFFEDFLLQLYDSIPIPSEIIVPKEIDGVETLEEFFSNKAKKKVKIIVPKQGDKLELLEFVSKNITATFFAGNARVEELKIALNLEKSPRVIECFDISHLAGTNTVAAMVTFTDGFPDKSNYRKFRIRAPTSSDDLWAMKEVVKRRYERVINDRLRKPDLIVIDGGPTQLSVAFSVLKELKLTIPVISLAKQFEEIYLPNKSVPVRLDKKHKGLQLLQAIRDEAHRFSNAYRKVLKRKELFGE
ncbi:MAG: excinuclease ABC subunit UvrC [archaeon]